MGQKSTWGGGNPLKWTPVRVSSSLSVSPGQEVKVNLLNGTQAERRRKFCNGDTCLSDKTIPLLPAVFMSPSRSLKQEVELNILIGNKNRKTCGRKSSNGDTRMIMRRIPSLPAKSVPIELYLLSQSENIGEEIIQWGRLFG